jgi:hypothetical protein
MWQTRNYCLIPKTFCKSLFQIKQLHFGRNKFIPSGRESNVERTYLIESPFHLFFSENYFGWFDIVINSEKSLLEMIPLNSSIDPGATYHFPVNKTQSWNVNFEIFFSSLVGSFFGSIAGVFVFSILQKISFIYRDST